MKGWPVLRAAVERLRAGRRVVARRVRLRLGAGRRARRAAGACCTLPTPPGTRTSSSGRPTCSSSRRSCASRTRSSPARRCAAGCRSSRPRASDRRRSSSDGVNGLVVPADDAASLARALEGLVDDPDALDAMAAAAVTVSDALDRGPGARPRGPVPVAAGRTTPAGVDRACVCASCCSWPASRARRCATACACRQRRSPISVSRARCATSSIPTCPASPRSPTSSCCTASPPRSTCSPTIEAAHAAGAPVLFDADDLDLRPGHRRRDPRAADPPGARRRAVARGRAPLPHDARALRRLHRQHARARRRGGHPHGPAGLVLPERHRQGAGPPCRRRPAHPASRRARPASATSAAPTRTTSTGPTSRPRWPQVLERHPDGPPAARRPHPRRPRSGRATPTGSTVCPSPTGSTCRRVLRTLDVNLAPLAPGSVFNEAKSAIKWLEAALVATPTVASPTEPYVAAIDHGRTGLLAAEPGRVGGGDRRPAVRPAPPGPDGRRRPPRRAARAVPGRAGPALPRHPRRRGRGGAAAPGSRRRRRGGGRGRPRRIVLEPYGDLDARAVERRQRAELRWRHVRELGRRARASVQDDGIPHTVGRAARRLFRVARSGRPR